MGTTFASIQVRCASQETVVQSLAGLLKAPAYVSPSIGDWVGVYPEEGSVAIEELAAQVSERTTLPVLAWLVYDSDVFFYHLYESGERRDEFDSNPHYFEGQVAEGDEGEQEQIDPIRVQGDPQALLPYCLPGTTLAAIGEVLHPAEPAEASADTTVPLPGFPEAGFQQIAKMLGTTVDALKQGVERKVREKYVFAEHQAADLSRLLGIGDGLAQIEFSDIARDGLDDYDFEGVKATDFRLAGADNLSQEYKDKKIMFGVELMHHPEQMQEWLQKGANPNARDHVGRTVLFQWAEVCFPEQIAILLEAGADVDAATNGLGRWERGVTALMVAAGRSYEQPNRVANTIKLLLEAGANVNARSESGRTALSASLAMTDGAEHQEKVGRHAPEEVLKQAAERSAQVAEILRAAGAMG